MFNITNIGKFSNDKPKIAKKAFKPIIPKSLDVPLLEKIKEENALKERIDNLKRALENTDYKIIKCSECQLAGKELPYDIVALNDERQAIRDKINELEQ